MVKAWQEAATPGAEHQLLKGLVGKWKVTTRATSTATLFMEGTMASGSKIITQSGQYVDPVKKEPQKMRSEFKIIDKDNATFVIYMPDMITGKEYKGMEQVYKRQ